MKRTLCIIVLLVTLLLPFHASAEITAEQMAGCKALIEMVLTPDEYSSYEVEYDNSGFIIYETVEGAFFSCVSYASGLVEDAQWDRLVKSSVDYMESIRNLIYEVTGENLSLLYVMSDTSWREVPFLVIYNGTVVYDCMPTWSWFFSTNE